MQLAHKNAILKPEPTLNSEHCLQYEAIYSDFYRQWNTTESAV